MTKYKNQEIKDILINLDVKENDLNDILYIIEKLPKLNEFMSEYFDDEKVDELITRESIINAFNKSNINLPTLTKYNSFLDIFSTRFEHLKSKLKETRTLNTNSHKYESNLKELKIIEKTITDISKFFLHQAKLTSISLAKKIYVLNITKENVGEEKFSKLVKEFKNNLENLKKLDDSNTYIDLSNLKEDIREFEDLYKTINKDISVKNSKKHIAIFISILAVLLAVIGVSIWAFLR